MRTQGDPGLARSIRVSPSTPADNDLLLQALGAAPAPARREPGRVAARPAADVRDHSRCRVAVDGSGAASIATGIGFLDHMLTALSCTR